MVHQSKNINNNTEGFSLAFFHIYIEGWREQPHIMTFRTMNTHQLIQNKSEPRKVKVKSSLILIKHRAMKTDGRMNVWLHAFLALVLDGGEWSASLPGYFTPER
jgi:hypothetical protein